MGSFKALFLQPTSSNLHYVAEAEPLPLLSPNWIINDIQPHYHFGFDLGLGVVNCCRNATAQLNYRHFRSSDSDSKKVSPEDMVGPFFAIGPDAEKYKQAKGTVVFRYDAFNLDYGICVKLGSDSHLNFFGGLEGVRIEQKLLSTYSNCDETISRKITAPSRFLGMGPQIGIDFSHALCKCLQLTGGGTGALLTGTLKNHTTYLSVSPELEEAPIGSPNKQTTKVHNRTQVIPGFQAKLGLAYNYVLCNCTINLDVGYDARIYLNAIQSVDMGGEVPISIVEATAGVFAQTFVRSLSNFALAGPYLQLAIGF